MATSSTNLTSLYGGNTTSVIVTGQYGNANVVSLLANNTDGANTIGNISATGNIRGANVIATINVRGGNILTNGFVSAAGDVYGDNLVATNGVQADSVVAINDITGTNLTINGSGSIHILNSDLGQFNGNITSTEQISAVGNIISNQYFIGNGYYLTGISGGGGGGGNSIVNGTSSVVVAPNGNITVTVTSGLVTTFETTGVVVNGIVSASGNVRGGNINTAGNVNANYYIGNGSALTGIQATSVGILPSLSVTGTTQTGNLLTGGVVSATGNVTGANYNTSGLVSAAGNITAGQFFVGNGSALTGVVATGVGVLSSLSVTGNTQTGNLNTAGIVSATGNILGNNLNILNAANIVGNLTVGGIFNTSGLNLSGSLQANYLESNTAVIVGTFVSAAGNITGDNYFANSVSVAGPVSASGNVNGANLIASANVISSKNLSASGNVWFAGPATNGQGIYWLNGTGGGIYRPIGTDSNTTIQTNNLTVTGIGEGGNILVGNIVVGQITASTVSASGNVLSGGRVSAGGNVLGTNLLASQTMSATGNITGGNLIGSSGSSAVGVVNYKDYVATITYASTITPNIAEGSIQQCTLTGNVTLNAFGGTPQAGQSLVIKLIQDSTGGRILSSTMKWAGGNKTLSTAANAVDIASIFYDGTTYYASLTTAYA
jgi:hypothetical protein